MEGFRTQSRQDHLYDQGRVRPGEIVTWTKASKHTFGLAADVTIDGGTPIPRDSSSWRRSPLRKDFAHSVPRIPVISSSRQVAAPPRGATHPIDAVNIDDNVSRAIGIAMDQGSVTDSTRDDSDNLNNFNGLLSRVGRGASTGIPQIQMPMMSGTAMEWAVAVAAGLVTLSKDRGEIALKASVGDVCRYARKSPPWRSVASGRIGCDGGAGRTHRGAEATDDRRRAGTADG